MFSRSFGYLGASLIAPDPLRSSFITVSRSYVHLKSFPLFGLSRPALFAFVSEFAHSDSVSFLRSLARLGFTPPVFDFLHLSPLLIPLAALSATNMSAPCVMLA